MESLPIDAHLPEIAAALARARAVVILAEPGAGKTTRVPPALGDAGPVLLLQPRRSAARAIARRIADERRWTVGHEVGWQIRFERNFNAETRLLVATEGILTARLQRDPLLSEFHTVVLDEFHERSIHTDLGLALTRQAWLARPDLRIVVMSATLHAEPVSAFLDGCPILRVAGRTFPLDIRYAPHTSVAEGVSELLARTSGSVLCFVPGAADIERTLTALRPHHQGLELLPLHGGLDAAGQDRALQPSATRRVVVATNIAETSVTVPGVTGVVDTGQHKVARYDHTRALDSLVLERITQDAADQRAGRAGRTAPGHVLRLWSGSDRLRPSREPEVQRIDLAACVLDLIACGEDPQRFSWFEPPRPDALASALTLLERLGATAGPRLTAIGERMRTLPLAPRLARMLIAADGSKAMTRACALLSDRSPLQAGPSQSTSDLLSALDRWSDVLPYVDAIARQVERAWGSARRPSNDDERAFRRAVLAGYPDRVARRRSAQADTFKLATGAGAALSRESSVRGAEFIVAIEVVASTRSNDPDARIRAASAVDADWLTPTAIQTRTFIDDRGIVRSAIIERYDALVLTERPTRVDLEAASRLLIDAWRQASRSDGDRQLLLRLKFSNSDTSESLLLEASVMGKNSLAEIRLADALSAEVRRRLMLDAPETLTVPSGRAVPLVYGDDGTVSASVKLQELFGLGETPRLGPTKEPVVFSLLAPNGRAVQVTKDLRSFWTRTYPEVRKELRGRYPRHPWPEDPWNAVATERTAKRGTSHSR